MILVHLFVPLWCYSPRQSPKSSEKENTEIVLSHVSP